MSNHEEDTDSMSPTTDSMSIDEDESTLVVDGWFEQDDELLQTATTSTSTSTMSTGSSLYRFGGKSGLAKSFRKLKGTTNFQSTVSNSQDVEDHLMLRRLRKTAMDKSEKQIVQLSRKTERVSLVPLKYGSVDAAQMISNSVVTFRVIQRFRQYCNSKQFLKQRNRMRAIKEVINTETSYVRSMKAFSEVYLKSIIESRLLVSRSASFLKKSSTAIATNTSITSMLGYADQIISINENLLYAFDEEFAKLPTVALSKPFMTIAPFLKVYVDYINGYDDTMKLYQKLLKKNEKFKDLMETCERNPRAENHSFEALLILPVQRIPRYRLLFNEILANTDSNHVEFENLKKALDTIIEIALHVNEQKRHSDYQIMIGIMARIVKHVHGISHDSIVTPGRKLLRDPEKLYVAVKESSSEDKKDNSIKCYKTFFFTDVLIFVQHDLYEKYSKEKEDYETVWKDPSSVHIVYYALSKLIQDETCIGDGFIIETLTKGKGIQFKLQDSVDIDESALVEAFVLVQERINRCAADHMLGNVPLYEYASQRTVLEETKKEYDSKMKRLQISAQETKKQLTKIQLLVQNKQTILRQLQQEIDELNKTSDEIQDKITTVEESHATWKQEFDRTQSDIRQRDETLMKALKDPECFSHVFNARSTLDDDCK
jgi:hypothetical protein